MRRRSEWTRFCYRRDGIQSRFWKEWLIPAGGLYGHPGHAFWYAQRNYPLSEANQSTVKRLPQADSILALGQSGEVVGHGTFQELDFPAGYARELDNLPQGNSDKTLEDEQNILSGIYDKSKAEDAAVDESRKVGDWATYKFYFKSLGWTRLFLFVLFVSINQLFQGLQSSCDPSGHTLKCSTNNKL